MKKNMHYMQNPNPSNDILVKKKQKKTNIILSGQKDNKKFN